MTVVVFALAFEAGSWRLPGVEVCVLGVGGRQAEAAFARWLDNNPRPSRVILAGLAGGLDPSLKIGDAFAVRCGEFVMADDLPGADLLTVDHVIATAVEKLSLWRQTGAGICDMETAHLVAVCRQCGIPWAGIRVVSDICGDDLPVPPDLLICPGTGQPATLRLSAYVAGRPRLWAGFVRMVRRAGVARRVLGTVLSRALAA